MTQLWARLLFAALVLAGLPAFGASKTAESNAEDGAEAAIELTIVTVQGWGQDPNGTINAFASRTGTGVIAGLNANGLLVWTAGHLTYDESSSAKKLKLSVTPNMNGAKSVWATIVQTFDDRDLALLQIPRAALPLLTGASSRSPNIECHRLASIYQLTSETELVVVGRDDHGLTWARLNRFSSATDEYVKMETPVDKKGFSGSPVFTRKDLSFVGIYSEGSSGVVSVGRVDTVEYQKGVRSPSCLGGRAVAWGSREALRMRFGFAQLTTGPDKLMNPFIATDYAFAIGPFGSQAFSLHVPLGAGVGVSLLNAATDSRNLFFEGYLDLGVGFSPFNGFIELLWTPEYYLDALGSHVTAKGFRVDLGRRFGDATAGIAVTFLDRGVEHNLTTFSVFTDASLTSRSGSAMSRD